MPDFLKGLKDLIDSAKKPGSTKSPAGKAVLLGRLVLVPLPVLPETPLPSESDRLKAATAIAQSLYDAVRTQHKIAYERLAVYLPHETSTVIRQVFPTPEAIQQLRAACESKLFTTVIGGSTNVDRLIIMDRSLNLHWVFDSLLKGCIIARPLGAGEMLVSSETGRNDREAVQVLIGVVEIERGGTKLAREPIWAYKSPGINPRITVNFDFDLLAKGFPREYRCFPLGIDIRCLFQESGGMREIDEVVFEFSEAAAWLGRVPSLKYELHVGNSQSADWVQLRDYLKQHTTLPLNKEPTPKGDFKISDNLTLPLNRFQTILIGAAEVEYKYICGFFPQALSFDPRRNKMIFSGQLLPEAGGDVAFPPSPQDLPVTAFHLSPVPTQVGEFELTLPAFSDYTLIRKSVALTGPVRCSFGDEITATDNLGRGSSHVFKIIDLHQVPDEVINAVPSRKYCAFINVTPSAERFYQLSDETHILRKGRDFPEDAFNIPMNAVRFDRPYLTLKVKALDKKQPIFFVSNASAPSAATAKPIAKKVPDDGQELFLNADYHIYVGDFRLTLNLAATPNSAMAINAGGP